MRSPVFCLMLLSSSMGIIRASPTQAAEDSGTLDVSRSPLGSGQKPGLPDTSQTSEGLPRVFFDRIASFLGFSPKRDVNATTAGSSCGANTTDAKVGNKTAALLRQTRSFGTRFNLVGFVQTFLQIVQDKLQANGVPKLTDIVLDVYGAACSERDCAGNAGICLGAISPPKNMSEYNQQCIPAMSTVIREDNNGTKGARYCVLKAILESMNLTFTDDPKQNAVTYLRARLTDNPALHGAGKDVVESVENGICVPSSLANFTLREEIKFGLCLIRQCVEAMAKNATL
ncbi:uncharacterized protein LOC135210506 [Macrobrachium nipponense]|uniref:uncharacterized protein LOC135210506 n=1 Tax=Macrobrachium nipponense TaxID=159736 RepID=UPI0030C7D9A8